MCWGTWIGYTFSHQMAPLALTWKWDGGGALVLWTACQLCLLFHNVSDVDVGGGVDVDVVQLVGHLLLSLSVEIFFSCQCFEQTCGDLKVHSRPPNLEGA